MPSRGIHPGDASVRQRAEPEVPLLSPKGGPEEPLAAPRGTHSSPSNPPETSSCTHGRIDPCANGDLYFSLLDKSAAPRGPGRTPPAQAPCHGPFLPPNAPNFPNFLMGHLAIFLRDYKFQLLP